MRKLVVDRRCLKSTYLSWPCLYVILVDIIYGSWNRPGWTEAEEFMSSTIWLTYVNWFTSIVKASATSQSSNLSQWEVILSQFAISFQKDHLQEEKFSENLSPLELQTKRPVDWIWPRLTNLIRMKNTVVQDENSQIKLHLRVRWAPLKERITLDSVEREAEEQAQAQWSTIHLFSRNTSRGHCW